MKIFEILDSEEKLSIGCLLYFEREKSFVIELRDYLDEWTSPLLFFNLVKNGKFTMGRELSFRWVSERIIPSGRQNIASILANEKLSRYDEITFLERANGICSQDNLYIKKLEGLPEFVRTRMEHNLEECIPCDDHSLLCFFSDKSVRKIKLDALKQVEAVKKITSNETLFMSAHIAAGGYCLTFNDSIDIDASLLYESGVEVPLSLDDFISFVKRNVVDTSECCNILNCSRQNISNYTSTNLLLPIKQNVKGKLFTKGNIYRL